MKQCHIGSQLLWICPVSILSLWDELARLYRHDHKNMFLSPATFAPDPADVGMSFMLFKLLSLLAELPQSCLAPLQWVSNAVARLVCDLSPRDHVTKALINPALVVSCRTHRVQTLRAMYTELCTATNRICCNLSLRSDGNQSAFRHKLYSCWRMHGLTSEYENELWYTVPADVRTPPTLPTFKKKLKTFFMFSQHIF